jgi:hypothetical protein
MEIMMSEVTNAMANAVRYELTSWHQGLTETELVGAATDVVYRLDMAGWELVRKPESQRAEEARQYRPQTVSSTQLAAVMGTIMGMLSSIIDWQTRVDEIVEQKLGIVVSP